LVVEDGVSNSLDSGTTAAEGEARAERSSAESEKECNESAEDEP
jgi:hypothetical protein